MKEVKEKQNQCKCEVQTPEMMLWGFVGVVFGGLITFPFQKRWITGVSMIFFCSLFCEICRRKQGRAKNNKKLFKKI